MSKTARVRIKVDMEIDCDIDGFDESDPEFVEHVRFFFEENHCVENETRRALELLTAAQGRANVDFRVKNPGLYGGVCITCHAADVTLIRINE